MTTTPDKLRMEGAAPLWQQMAASLRGRIARGELAPGQRLPSETELGVAYDISRITVRKALAALTEEHAVVRSQGRGTFVAERAIRHSVSGLAGIIDSITMDGAAPRTRLVSLGPAPVPAPVAKHLRDGSNILHLRRLYTVDQAYFGLADVWIPEAAHLTRDQVGDAPAYTVLSRYLRVVVARAQAAIRAQTPAADVLKLMGMPRNTTLLCLERTSFSADGSPIEHTRFWVRPQNYEFSVVIDGPLRLKSALRDAA